MIIDSITDKKFITSEYKSEYEGSTLKITEIGKKFLNSYDNIEMGYLKKNIKK